MPPAMAPTFLVFEATVEYCDGNGVEIQLVTTLLIELVELGDGDVVVGRVVSVSVTVTHTVGLDVKYFCALFSEETSSTASRA